VIDHIPIDHRTLGGSFGAARIAYRIGHVSRADREDNAKYDPEKHAHSSPFLPRAVPSRLRVVPPRLERTLAFVFASGQAGRVISVRAVKIEKQFTGSQAKGKGLGSMSGNGTAIVAFTLGLLHTQGKERWSAFAKTGNSAKSMPNFMA
jgi:hypothetical protein